MCWVEPDPVIRSDHTPALNHGIVKWHFSKEVFNIIGRVQRYAYKKNVLIVFEMFHQFVQIWYFPAAGATIDEPKVQYNDLSFCIDQVHRVPIKILCSK